LFLESQLQTYVDKLEPPFEEIFEALDREADNLGIVDVVIGLKVDPLVSDV